MQIKTHKLSLKSIEDDGSFEGYASVFNVIDYQKDIILPGAFKTDTPVKMLWQHDAQKPIGIWDSLYQDAYGLYVKGHLLMDLSAAKEAYTLLKAGVVDGLSIGFFPKKSHFDTQKKARLITEVDLIEISLVTFAANPKAKVTSVKTQTHNNILPNVLDKIKNLCSAFLNADQFAYN